MQNEKISKLYGRFSSIVLTAALMIVQVYATDPVVDDPLSIINNLSAFVFSAIRAIGMILLGWGIVQIGMSLQSHDPSQRTNGFFCFFGGLLIAMSKAILDLILA